MTKHLAVPLCSLQRCLFRTQQLRLRSSMPIIQVQVDPFGCLVQPICNHIPHRYEMPLLVVRRQPSIVTEPGKLEHIIQSLRRAARMSMWPKKRIIRSIWYPQGAPGEQRQHNDTQQETHQATQRLDDIYYSPLDKCRSYQRTWEESPLLVPCLDEKEPPKIICCTGDTVSSLDSPTYREHLGRIHSWLRKDCRYPHCCGRGNCTPEQRPKLHSESTKLFKEIRRGNKYLPHLKALGGMSVADTIRALRSVAQRS